MSLLPSIWRLHDRTGDFMRLRSIRVLGFQSFSDSGEVVVEEGFNLVIGQNNSGKSALLRAMTARFANDRHRTPESWEEHKLAQPEVVLAIETSGAEFSDAILRMGGALRFPIHASWNDGFEKIVQDYMQRPIISLNASCPPNHSGFNMVYPGHGLFIHEVGSPRVSTPLMSINGELQIGSNRDANNDDSIAAIAWEIWTD